MKNETTIGCSNCMFYSEAGGCSNPEKCVGFWKKDLNNLKPFNTITVKCLVCGKEVVLTDLYLPNGIICEDCKKAIHWAKRGLEAEITKSLECRQGMDPNGFKITVKEFVQRFVPHGSTVQLYKEDVVIINGKTEITYNKIWEGADHFITDDDEKAFCSSKDFLVEGLITFKNDVLKSVDSLGKIAISVRSENEKTSKELEKDHLDPFSNQSNSKLNGTKGSIISTMNLDETKIKGDLDKSC